jgi:peptidoglycan/LPS O-acetylase OafA/YrhL
LAGGDGRRIPELDALRGLACLVILVYHLKPHLVPGGWAAVDLFFILSGFLITSIILNHANERHFLAHFYARRGLRIWPVYYLTVLLLVVTAPVLPRPCDFSGLPYLLTYSQNVPRYWGGEAPEFSPYLSHAWSLAVEEQFYLVWPLLVGLAGRRGVVPLALAMAGVSVWARARGFHWWLLLARGDGLALGALLAVLRPDRGRPGRRASGLGMAFGGVGLAALGYLVALASDGGLSTVGTPRWPALTLLVVNLLGFAIVGLVLCHLGRPALWPLRVRSLVGVGTLSYGLYVYHYVVLSLSDDIARRLGMGGRPFWREALTIVAIVVLARLSWRYVERPLLGLKDRFAYGPSPPTGPSGPHRAEMAKSEGVTEGVG